MTVSINVTEKNDIVSIKVETISFFLSYLCPQHLACGIYMIKLSEWMNEYLDLMKCVSDGSRTGNKNDF